MGRPRFAILRGVVMAKPELGTKRVCVQCGARFYDLMKQPAICPKCGAEQPAEQPRLRRLPAAPVEDKRPKKVVSPAIEDGDLDIEVAEDADVLEDTADLEDDADAIDADIEVEPDSDDTEH
jgi:uncharacterized protein (TIGR02300 family)